MKKNFLITFIIGTRPEAINRMLGALDECVFEGIKTIIPFQKQILNDSNFKKGIMDTSFLENFKYKKEN